MNITDSNIYSIEDEMSVIKIAGKDAASFLQGQFSNDIQELDGKNYQISSKRYFAYGNFCDCC